MIYVFTDERDHTFWMEGTAFSLDLVFLNKDAQVIGVIPGASPNAADHLSIDKPSLYVLEVAGGFAAKHGVEAGGKVTLSGVPHKAAL